MKDVDEIKSKPNALFLDTGSPHHIQLVDNLSDYNVVKEGARLRYGIYGEAGSNINFGHEQGPNAFSIRTYERGVEDETLSCGTGVTAVALAMHSLGKTKSNDVSVKTLGGELSVRFKYANEKYSEIYLIGEAKQVFKGDISW